MNHLHQHLERIKKALESEIKESKGQKEMEYHHQLELKQSENRMNFHKLKAETHDNRIKKLKEDIVFWEKVNAEVSKGTLSFKLDDPVIAKKH